MIEWILPLEIQSPNIKEHWSKIYARNNRNKDRLQTVWSSIKYKPTPPCTVSLQRLYNPSIHQKLWDEDNYSSALKGIRDIIADFLVPGKAPGQADNLKHGIKFQYDQLTCRKTQTITYIKQGKKLIAVKLTHLRVVIITQEEIEEHLAG